MVWHFFRSFFHITPPRPGLFLSDQPEFLDRGKFSNKICPGPSLPLEKWLWEHIFHQITSPSRTIWFMSPHFRIAFLPGRMAKLLPGQSEFLGDGSFKLGGHEGVLLNLWYCDRAPISQTVPNVNLASLSHSSTEMMMMMITCVTNKWFSTLDWGSMLKSIFLDLRL